MASLVEQIYMQAQGGSAGGAGFADFLVQGRQLNQRQQQINMQESQLAAELSMVPLKKTLLQQDAQMNALKIQADLEARQQQIKNNLDFLTLNQLIPKAFSEADGFPTAMQIGVEAITKNPYLATDPRFKGLFDTITKAQEATESMMRAEAYRARVDTASGNLDLALKREDRLGDMFEFQKQKFAADIPRDRLSLFNARAQVIKNDLNLIGNTTEQVRQLNELAKEFGVGMPATAVPSTTPPVPGKKIGRFEVVPK